MRKPGAATESVSSPMALSNMRNKSLAATRVPTRDEPNKQFGYCCRCGMSGHLLQDCPVPFAKTFNVRTEETWRGAFATDTATNPNGNQDTEPHSNVEESPSSSILSARRPEDAYSNVEHDQDDNSQGSMISDDAWMGVSVRTSDLRGGEIAYRRVDQKGESQKVPQINVSQSERKRCTELAVGTGEIVHLVANIPDLFFVWNRLGGFSTKPISPFFAEDCDIV